MRFASVYLLSFALASCTSIPPNQTPTALSYKIAMLGKTRAQLLMCAGVPDKTFDDGSAVYFSYSNSNKSAKGGSLGYSGKRSFGISGFSAVEDDCVATVELRNGKVSGVSYKSPTEGPTELCSSIFESCMTDPSAEHSDDTSPAALKTSPQSSGVLPSRTKPSDASGEKLYAEMIAAYHSQSQTTWLYGLFESEAMRLENYILTTKGQATQDGHNFTVDASLSSNDQAAIRWFMPIFSDYRVF